MAQDFQTGLAASVQDLPRWSIKRRWVEFITSLPDDDPRKQHFLLAAEARTRKHLGLSDDAEIDWTQGAVNGSATAIDWKTILQFFITNILPLLIKLLGG